MISRTVHFYRTMRIATCIQLFNFFACTPFFVLPMCMCNKTSCTLYTVPYYVLHTRVSPTLSFLTLQSPRPKTTSKITYYLPLTRNDSLSAHLCDTESTSRESKNKISTLNTPPLITKFARPCPASPATLDPSLPICHLRKAPCIYRKRPSPGARTDRSAASFAFSPCSHPHRCSQLRSR